MNILYFDCFSGISGDMTVAALIDLGVPADWLETELKKLDLANYKLQINKTDAQSISATKFDVKIDEQKHPRNLSDILNIINKSEISQKAKDLSIKIFDKIAKAEAKIHNKDISKVHFHEVGAVDSIIDIVGAALCITKLAPNKIYSSPLPLSKGKNTFSHGTWPLPTPATLEILKHAPCYQIEMDKELVTPTGAAIITTIADQFINMPMLKISKIGYGAGTHKTKVPNVLRVISGESEELSKNLVPITVIETNIDDMNPEFFEFLYEKLFSTGALDVFMTNIMMKKTRPGILLSVLCNKKDTNKISELILSNTSSIGVRIREDMRVCLPREIKKVKTPYGEVNVKISKLADNNINIAPEYEDCKKLAQEYNVSLKEVYNAAISNYLKK